MFDIKFIEKMNYIHEIDKKFFCDSLIPVLHYVSGIGVPELIIEHKQLRLSRISDMRNDPEEGEYVIRIFRDCLSELRDENSITAEDCKLLEGCILNLDCPHLYSSYGGQSKSQRVKTIPYVACFTLADNQHMWSEYSDGIALKFWMNESLLMREHKRDGSNYSSYFKIYKVQYDSPEFRKWMKEMIMGAKNPYNNDEWVEYVHELLVRSHIAVKDSKFKDEKEFRLVFFKPEGMKSDDPLCEHLCQTHVDLIGSEQVVNPFDPESDEYVWIDVSKLLNGVVMNINMMDVGWIEKVAPTVNIIDNSVKMSSIDYR